MIDTHAHIYASQFDKDREETITRAKQAGVKSIFLPNIDRSSIDSMLQMEQDYPDYCYAMMGIHPTSIKADYEAELAVAERYLSEREFVAVGEIGIDLYWDKTFRKEQEDAFLRQAEWAKELDIPIIIHARESLDILIDLVKQVKTDRLRGIFHCFTGTREQAERIMDLEFLMGIGGVVTFKNAGLAEAISKVPLDYLVLETDSPYLAPAPYRGKRNESAYLTYVVDKLVDCKQVGSDEIKKATTRNARQLFFGKKQKKGEIW